MESEPSAQNSGTVNETGGGGSGTVQSASGLGSTAKTISIFEGLANISPNKDEIIYFDISTWNDKTDIKKIKLLVNPYAYYSDSQNLLSQSDADNPDITGQYDFNLYVYSIVSAHISRMSIFQTFLIILLIIIFVVVGGYGALYVRARIIKKKRRQLRERELQKRRAQAAASRNQGIPGQYNKNINQPPGNTQERTNRPPNDRNNNNNLK